MTKVKQLRMASGMTQEQLAAASGVKLATIQKLESGVNNISGAKAETVLHLARALGTTVEDMLGK